MFVLKTGIQDLSQKFGTFIQMFTYISSNTFQASTFT